MLDAKEQIREAVDIVDLVGGYIALRRQGRGFVGLCPWHDDSRPSLQVNQERQSFKCWVCDYGGDIFSFVMRMEGLEFREALELLAERAGIELAPARPSGADSQFDRRNLLRAMQWAEKQFHDCLLKSPQADPARQYLAERGITDESVAQFQLGFSPPEWQWLVNRAQRSEWELPVLERVGLIGQRESGGFYDRFRGRLMFSIRDVRSRPIAFGGRVLPAFASEKDAKYINSPETPLFSKSRELYALNLARDAAARQSQLIVMEGYTDVIMAHQYGIDNAVAVLGTALGEQHVPLIRRFTDSITLVLDGDSAGQSRTMDILDNLLALFVTHEVELRILGLPEGADPCDVIRSQGCEAFRELLGQSRDALTHKMDVVMSSLGSAPASHRAAQAVESILATLARAMPQGARPSSVALVRQQQVLVRVARAFGMAEEDLRGRLNALRQSLASRARASRPVADESLLEAPSPPTSNASTSASAGWERELVELFLARPDSLDALASEIEPSDISSSSLRRIYLVALEMYEAGQRPDYDRLMLAIDDAELKSLLVDCDQANSEKSDSDPGQRLADALRAARKRRKDSRHQARMMAFHQKNLAPEQEEEALAELFHELKQQHDSQQRPD